MNNNFPKYTKLVIVLCTFIIQFKDSSAQGFELAGISSVTYPKSGVKDINKNPEISFQEFGAFINIPYKIKNSNTLLINGLGYGWVESSGLDELRIEPSLNSEQLHALYYQLMLFHKINNNWHMLINLRPTIASDFEERLSTDDFVVQGVGFAVRKINEHLSFGIGLAYTMRFGKPFAVPVLPLNYEKGKHNISSLFPINSTYKYSLGNKEKWSVGFKHMISGAQFNITAPDVNESDVSDIDKISYTRANIGAAFNYNITKFVQFELYGGASVRRQYNLIDKSNKIHEFNLQETPFVQLGINIVPPKKKK